MGGEIKQVLNEFGPLAYGRLPAHCGRNYQKVLLTSLAELQTIRVTTVTYRLSAIADIR